MTFRATNILPEEAYRLIKKRVAGLKAYIDQQSAFITSGGDSNSIFAIVDSLNNQKAQLNQYKGTPGLAAYAQAQENDPGYDPVVEYNALIALIDTAVATVVSTFPNDGTYILGHVLNSDGTRSPRTFTGVQLSGLKTALDAISADIV